MWQTKIFTGKTMKQAKEKMTSWLAKNSNKIQWREIFVNNAYGIEYRNLRRIF